MFPVCAGCGGATQLQVHHIVPFHVSPDLELVPQNLITLCMGDHDCHLKLGHGGAFRCYNPEITKDVKVFRESGPGRRLMLLKEIREKRLVG
jgi:5-methylcytosine-specific restriction protein A